MTHNQFNPSGRESGTKNEHRSIRTLDTYAMNPLWSFISIISDQSMCQNKLLTPLEVRNWTKVEAQMDWHVFPAHPDGVNQRWQSLRERTREGCICGWKLVFLNEKS